MPVSAHLVVLSVFIALLPLVLGKIQLSGCGNFMSEDDLTNRVMKKSTLSFVTRLLADSKEVVQKGVTSCPELTIRGFDINLQPLEDFARLATRNGHVLQDMLNSKSKRFLDNVDGWPAPANPSGSIVAPAKGCKNEANPFAHGNSIFGSLTQSTLLSSRRLFAAGGCLGMNPTTGTSECFYRYVDYATNATPVDYGLYPVSSNTWFTIPRDVVKEINKTLVETGGLAGITVPVSMEQIRLTDRIINRLNIGYSIRLWTNPYFDCVLGKIWMITYSAPISYVADDGQVHNVGITGVDINLSDIDLDECSPSSTDANTALDSFRNTHLCEATSTMCRTVAGRGFNFGSYQCHCRPGFYKRSQNGSVLQKSRQFFEGIEIENATERIRGNSSCKCNDTTTCRQDAESIRAILNQRFSCLPCPEGCDTCETGNEVCTLSINPYLPLVAGVLNSVFLLTFLVLAGVVAHLRSTHVFRSASWPFLITVLIGSTLAVLSVSLMPFKGRFRSLPVNDVICALQPWLQYIGFALTYGSILVKTWRLDKIFSGRRCKAKKLRSNLSNFDLATMLAAIVLCFAVLLMLWTIGKRPVTETKRTVSGLKYKQCSVSFVNTAMDGITLCFLLPVVYLSYKLRNITDDFSETKEISIGAYIFLIIKVVFMATQNIVKLLPDVRYVVQCLDINLSFTLLVLIFFLSKIWRLSKHDRNSLQIFLLDKKAAMSERQNSTVSLDLAHRRRSGSISKTTSMTSIIPLFRKAKLSLSAIESASPKDVRCCPNVGDENDAHLAVPKASPGSVHHDHDHDDSRGEWPSNTDAL